MPHPSLNRLSHLRLPNPIPYNYSLRLQEVVLNRHWTYRNALKSSTKPSSSSPSTHSLSLSPPPPTLLTFSTQPTYTVGRRHLTENPLSEAQIAFLTGKDTTKGTSQSNLSEDSDFDFSNPATFHPSPRGGLLTYHAPGQLTAYPLIDLRRFSLSARQYISLLEDVVISTCAAFGVANVGRSCGDPGVWVLNKSTGRVTDRKICAVGVRVTRGVGSHGVGLNVFDAGIPQELRRDYPFQDPSGNPLPPPTGDEGSSEDDTRGYLSWGFGRIVACGLEGKRTTWLTNEGADPVVKVGEVADVFAAQLLGALNASVGKGSADRIRLDGVERVTEEDILNDAADGATVARNGFREVL
jgi:lipoyl(octanoyl) transferase 2